jgi:hypothetical protein
MAEDDRRLRDLYAASAVMPGNHPDEGTWEALALGELPPARREEVNDHVVRCAECASIHRGLTMMAEEAAHFDPAVPRRRHAPVLSFPARWGWGALAAAAAALLIALVPLLRPIPAPVATPAGDRVRSGEGAVPVPLEPKGPLRAPPRVFRWQGIEAARRYRVEVSRGDGEPVWVSTVVEGTSVEWPSSLVPEPGVYFWQVVALPGTDRPIGTPPLSELVSFEIPAAR